MIKKCLTCKHYRKIKIPGIDSNMHLCLGDPTADHTDSYDVDHILIRNFGYIWDLDEEIFDDHDSCDSYEMINAEQPKNNQGRAACFKCGTETKKVPGMLANSFFDVCPNCKI